jgi:hypothetical protein
MIRPDSAPFSILATDTGLQVSGDSGREIDA